VHQQPRTYVYIDGFNFEYAAFRCGPFARYRWLDLCSFSDVVLRRNDVVAVRFFTARLRPLAGDLRRHLQQAAYLKALTGLPRLSLHFGIFVRRRVTKRTTRRMPGVPAKVEVWDIEEKGTDVNLASFLVRDGFRDEYDVAVVVSNDFDLQTPIRMVRDELGKQVGVIPVRHTSVFARDADFALHVRGSHFRRSQLPRTVALADGTVVHKPPEWEAAAHE